MTTIEKINLISGKIQQLLHKQQDMIGQNQALQAMLEQQKALLLQEQEENSRLRADLTITQRELERRTLVEGDLKIKVSELEVQVESLRNGSGSMDKATREAMEKQLEHYIKEIDKCIALLSQ